MVPPAPEAPRYHVSYSELVRNDLEQLAARATAAGHKATFLNALRDIDYRLHVFPQFGEPLRDLHMEGETDWIGIVPPLVVEYIIDEPRRMGFVMVPIKALPGEGFEGARERRSGMKADGL